MSHVKNASYDIILAEVSLSAVGKGMRIPLLYLTARLSISAWKHTKWHTGNVQVLHKLHTHISTELASTGDSRYRYSRLFMSNVQVMHIHPWKNQAYRHTPGTGNQHTIILIFTYRTVCLPSIRLTTSLLCVCSAHNFWDHNFQNHKSS